ncbi:monofunctional glycosyltransferase [Patescibacteria group bacterium]|nr:monofunctional glycosyltransferase [Patescibacteria group bacterium]
MAKKIKKTKTEIKQPNNLRNTIRKAFTYLVVCFVIASITSCLTMRWIPPLTSMVMVYRHIEDLPSFKWINYTWVSEENISNNAFVAVIASEDQRFFQHFGFDFAAIQDSVEDYMDGEKLRGASTITQQVEKNLYLTPSRSFIRKGLEIWFTLLLEICWDKQRIIEVYLNIAEFGEHIFGIEAASRHYFGISAKQLSKQQAALLAATLPNPIRFKADKPTAYVLKRQAWILRQMPNISYKRT